MILNGKFKNRYLYPDSGTTVLNEDAFLVTLCTKNYLDHFGSIENDGMVLSKAGLMAKECWLNLANGYPHIKTGPFVIMPNHVHGIIRIKQNIEVSITERMVSDVQVKLYTPQTEVQSIAAVVGDYKKQVREYIRKISPKFNWQPGFYDYSISSKSEYRMIKKHIRENPLNWKTDCFNFSKKAV